MQSFHHYEDALLALWALLLEMKRLYRPLRRPVGRLAETFAVLYGLLIRSNSVVFTSYFAAIGGLGTYYNGIAP